MMSFLTWAASGKSIPLTGLLQGSLLLSVPLIFGALSGVLCERAGVVNIAIEGQLLAGAFLSAVVGSLTDSLLAGLIAAVVAGLLVGWILAVFTVTYFVDQVIVGVVLNILVLGLTSFFYSSVLDKEAETWNSPPVFQPIAIPILSDIPIIGPIFFDQSPDRVPDVRHRGHVSTSRCSAPGGACACAPSASTRRPPTPSASTSTRCASATCCSAAWCPASAARSSPSARSGPSART